MSFVLRPRTLHLCHQVKRVCLSSFQLHPQPHSIVFNPQRTSSRNTTTMASSNTGSTDPSKYKFNHTMLRIKDPERSRKFYEGALGMTLINKLEQPEAKFDLYFYAYDHPTKAISARNHWTDREGVVELTHNYGTEKDENFKAANGNDDASKGFGHLCISVDNIQAACKRLEDNDVKFHKRLQDGRMRHIAFALDPDGYWVEVVGMKKVEEAEKETETDVAGYRMNHSMIRVKDAEKSLHFYKDVLGMTLKATNENKDNGYTLYFLGYGTPDDNRNGEEGLLELTWNYGTEKDEKFSYHNGNDEPQGFGHIAVTVDDLDAACARFEEKKVNWKKRLQDGRMHTVAFVLDPDGYWVEVLQNERMKRSSNW